MPQPRLHGAMPTYCRCLLYMGLSGCATLRRPGSQAAPSFPMVFWQGLHIHLSRQA